MLHNSTIISNGAGPQVSGGVTLYPSRNYTVLAAYLHAFTIPALIYYGIDNNTCNKFPRYHIWENAMHVMYVNVCSTSQYRENELLVPV